MWTHLLLRNGRRTPRRALPILTASADRSLSGGRGGKNNDKGRGGKKENFADKFLKPAARGELTKKHTSGIPRLAARRNKARLEPVRARHKDFLNYLDEGPEEGMALSETGSSSSSRPVIPEAPQPPEGAELLMAFGGDDPYFAPELLLNEKYYWTEEEIENLVQDPLTKEELGIVDGEPIEIPYTDDELAYRADDEETWADIEAIADDVGGDENESLAFSKGDQRGPKKYVDPEMRYFFDQHDLYEMLTNDDTPDDAWRPPNDVLVAPLRPVMGPDVEDFLDSMAQHPTQYALSIRENLHRDSRREPKPIFPGDRRNPPLEFVQQYRRFLYVTGLPPLTVNGEEGDLNNPIHAQMLQKTVAGLVSVDSTQVVWANRTSAFVGFHSPREMANALAGGPTEATISGDPTVEVYEGGEVFADAPGRCLKIAGFRPGFTNPTLLSNLFPSDSDLAEVYGSVSVDDVIFTSRTSAVIRFASEEMAQSALQSALLRHQVDEIGQYPVQFFRARRELVHDGYTGLRKAHEKRAMGPRLIVDGDMPTKDFYLTHARVIQLRGLDLSITKEELTKAFQPHCERLRDVEGSIEFVTCEAGLPTGVAFVGFDMPGEAERCMKAYSGKFSVGSVFVPGKLVHDRRIPGERKLRDRRLQRSEAELLEDLNNWERFVNPRDLAELQAAGIEHHVLDESIRQLRFNNKYFGALDSSLAGESIDPTKDGGELFKEMVQLYIETLKDCIATPENPGELFEAVHFPDEEIDISIFDRDRNRQKELTEKRANPPM